jgi:hypothetical protein
VATQDDLIGSDEKAYATADRIRGLVVTHDPSIVERVSANEEGGLIVLLSSGFRLVVVSDGVEESEDWRFFAPGVDAAHLVIKAGAIAPESFDCNAKADPRVGFFVSVFPDRQSLRCCVRGYYRPPRGRILNGRPAGVAGRDDVASTPKPSRARTGHENWRLLEQGLPYR